MLESGQTGATAANYLQVGERRILLRCIRHRRARRYVLRLSPDGSARVTIPRGGSAVGAWGFAQRNISWLQKQLLRQLAQSAHPKTWAMGAEILFRGERVRLERVVDSEPPRFRFGNEDLRSPPASADLRPTVERHLWTLARHELPARVLELSRLHGLTVSRVTVRNQRTRWGSCSRRGSISLNWRLIQTPPFVLDYIILHELAHLKQMNHSPRFWREVTRLCPDYPTAEHWLRQNARLLR